MEFNNFLPFVVDFFPDYLKENKDFISYLSAENVLEQYASLIMMTLPEPRTDYYSSSDFTKIRSGVLGQTNKIVQALGLYPIETQTELLETMNLCSFALLFIGIVFDILLIILVIISIFLIFSLLMITTETNTYDIGIMRMLGLSNSGFIVMILTQAVIFVVPSIVLAYICAFPSLYLIFKRLF